MNNALGKLKCGWKNVCKLWLQESTPYASRLTVEKVRVDEVNSNFKA
jgi:hypothetical protein